MSGENTSPKDLQAFNLLEGSKILTSKISEHNLNTPRHTQEQEKMNKCVLNKLNFQIENNSFSRRSIKDCHDSRLFSKKKESMQSNKENNSFNNENAVPVNRISFRISTSKKSVENLQLTKNEMLIQENNDLLLQKLAFNSTSEPLTNLNSNQNNIIVDNKNANIDQRSFQLDQKEFQENTKLDNNDLSTSSSFKKELNDNNEKREIVDNLVKVNNEEKEPDYKVNDEENKSIQNQNIFQLLKKRTEKEEMNEAEILFTQLLDTIEDINNYNNQSTRK